MTRFELFDAVALKEAIPLTGGGTAGTGTPGAIVEVLSEGTAYMVELFGGWVQASADGSMSPAHPAATGAFIETIGVEVVRAQQIKLVKHAAETVGSRSQLLIALEDLPEPLIAEVVDFAEFLRQKQRRQETTGARVP